MHSTGTGWVLRVNKVCSNSQRFCCMHHQKRVCVAVHVETASQEEMPAAAKNCRNSRQATPTAYHPQAFVLLFPGSADAGMEISCCYEALTLNFLTRSSRRR